MIKKLIIFLILIAASFGAIGQPSFEIRAVPRSPGGISVQMRAIAALLPGANDYVTDIVFGIKWNSSLNIDLSNSIATNYNIKKAGARSNKNTRHFQAFYSDPVGFNPPASWQQNSWVEIMAIHNLPGSGSATFEICEPGFDVTTNPNFGLNFIDFTPVINGSAADVPLPVVFLNFEAFLTKEHVQLSWNTSSEINSKEFFIQRSFNGIDFETINKMPAAGTSVSTKIYEYKDAEARKSFIGKNVFYRIVEMGLNGQLLYTGIKKVFIPNTKNSLKQAYNAETKEAVLFYDCQQSDNIVVTVFDMTGRTVLKKMTNVIGGNNQIVLPMNNLADGIYSVELSGRYDHQTISIPKQ